MVSYTPCSGPDSSKASSMTDTLERLRRLQGLRPQRSQLEADIPPAPYTSDQPARETMATVDRLAELPAGAVIENSAGSCFVRTERYPLGASRGPHAYGALLSHFPSRFAELHPNFGLDPAIDYTRAVFLDTETTGLGGGAGVYCFMVGVGSFENVEYRMRDTEYGTEDAVSRILPTHFVVRQFFMRHPGEEGALLLALAEVLDRHAMSVTFNGRTFDLPLLRTRFRQNQRIYADLRGCGRLLAPERPHLDLLHPARRLWRRRLQSCRLIHLEESILGVRRSEEDVPGHLIPQLYAAYIQNGDASAMRRVFYHNREDILSIVALTTQLSWAFDGGERAPLEREDWLALAVCFEEQNRWADAEAAYRRALDQVRDPQSQADTFARLGQLLKRQGRWDEAAELWERWLSTVPGLDLRPYVELAKYCEWQVRDYTQAAMWTQWAIHSLRRAPAWQRPPGALANLERRLTRLEHKTTHRDATRT